MEPSKLFHSLGPVIDKQKDFLYVLTLIYEINRYYVI